MNSSLQTYLFGSLSYRKFPLKLNINMQVWQQRINRPDFFLLFSYYITNSVEGTASRIEAIAIVKLCHSQWYPVRSLHG